MIAGTVTENGTPVIMLEVAGRRWIAIVDTGFNGDLELPSELHGLLHHEHMGRTISILAGGQQIEEDTYLVEIVFDGERVEAEVTFAPGDTILVGTRLLQKYRLEVVFPKQTVMLERMISDD